MLVGVRVKIQFAFDNAYLTKFLLARIQSFSEFVNIRNCWEEKVSSAKILLVEIRPSVGVQYILKMNKSGLNTDP